MVPRASFLELRPFTTYSYRPGTGKHISAKSVYSTYIAPHLACQDMQGMSDTVHFYIAIWWVVASFHWQTFEAAHVLQSIDVRQS